MKYVFIRNDDVYELDEQLRRFVVSCTVPVSHSVIPCRLTAECARYLVEMNADVCQHGSVHKKGHDNIELGYHKMNEFFGKWTKVYVPPWNTLTDRELAVIESIGYSGVSSDHDATMRIKRYGLNLYSFPISIEIRKEGFKTKNFADMLKEITRCIAQQTYIGVLLHYRDIKDYQILVDLLATIQGQQDVTMINFGMVLANVC